MTTKYKLAIIPEGYKVVPEEPTEEMCEIASINTGSTIVDGPEFEDALYSMMVAKAPQLTTSPVLRWRKNALVFYEVIIARVRMFNYSRWEFEYWGSVQAQSFDTPQEARRAAEKALGFPDGLVVEEA